MKFTSGASPSLLYSIAGSPYQNVSFHQPIPANSKFCPVILFYQQGLSFEVEIKGDKTSQDKAIVHPVAKFLISNNLEVCESSSLRAIQVMQKHRVEMTGIEVVSVTILPEHLQKILACAFMGGTDVLQYTFGDSSSTPEGSELSFVMS
eukprot:gnl/TRDRNA2_/TRDRNA2_150317_c0_seq1.p1 gnl/TRDRNA2_/TRDRNA2_150317_c0~~gnl/TRDRNA2_/TRDRNA2_150317_c0_seq1.p1  ORF type:complete len:163 (+),score=22.26 gnl/TRDRNA2_/TRDRNA2_150317_c0_seq1:44-490(+)